MKTHQTDFSKGSVYRNILEVAVPMTVAQFLNLLYNIVDRIFVGNFNGTSALAGLSICFPLSYMMMAFGLTCSAGGSTLFSLFAGKNDKEHMKELVRWH